MSEFRQPAASKSCYLFGPFRLSRLELRLERDGVIVDVGSRALEILLALVESAGEILSNQQLIERAWPNTFVDDANLRVHIVALRKVLGDDKKQVRYISNVPGRGYRFVMPVSPLSDAPGSSQDHRPTKSALPGRVIGRDSAIREVAARLQERRFVTIAGPGGIGKTTVALAVAEKLAGVVCFVDLGLLRKPGLVAKTLGFSLGLTGEFEDVKEIIKDHLQVNETIIIFDCCEHLVDEIASLAEELFAEIPSVKILATSREDLRAAGENVYRLAPLALPPAGSSLNVEEALRYPAIQLFVDRASANVFDFQMSDSDVSMVVDICRQLDGIALAIELAAGRVAVYGVDGILYLMQDRFRLLTNGKRTALPRHQTLQAAIDWSYDLLSEPDKVVLRRLSIFAAPFAFEAARAVAGCDGSELGQDLVSIFGDLVAKSLVTSDEPRGARLYRLLDTTRHYMRGKLVESGEFDQVAHCHARYYQEHLVDIAKFKHESATSFDTSKLSADIANVRAALEWCFSREETQRTGIGLVSVSAPLFLELSLVNDCLTWVARALEQLEPADRGGSLELQLQEILGLFRLFFRGHTEEAHQSILRGLELAGNLADARNRARLLDGLYIYHIRRGDLAESHRIAYGKSTQLAQAIDPPENFQWMRIVSASLVGDHDETISLSEKLLARYPVRRRVHAYNLLDHRVHIFASYARSLWLRGFPERALHAVGQAISEAEELEHPVSLCICLVWAIPPVIWAGDYALASQLAERLVTFAQGQVLTQFQALGTGWQGVLLIRNGQPSEGMSLLRGSLGEQAAVRHQLTRTSFLLEMAIGQSNLRQFDQAIGSLDEALERIALNGERILLPEVIRTKAEVLLKLGAPDLEARSLLNRSIKIAQEQSALSWQLRTAISIVNAASSSNDRDEALKALSNTLDRFIEGFETPDLRSARSLLAA